MKQFKLIFLGALLVCSNHLLQAQMPSPNSNPMDAAMLKLFGSNTNFTAKAEVQIGGKTAKESMSMSVNMATLGGKMRTEMDMSQMKNAMISPEMVKQMKQMGADRTVSIVRPDKKVTYSIYPGLKAYLEQPISDDKPATGKEPKVETTAIGKETIDGHPSTKNKVVITDETGKTQEATVWNATDLKNFPVQMQIQQPEGKVTVKFKDVQFGKPDAKLFEPPADFAKYTSMMKIQQMMMQKMMGSPGQ